MIEKWSFFEEFQSLSRKLFTVLHEKVDYARISEISPSRFIIDTRTADFRQERIKNCAAIQISFSSCLIVVHVIRLLVVGNTARWM